MFILDLPITGGCKCGIFEIACKTVKTNLNKSVGRALKLLEIFSVHLTLLKRRSGPEI